MTKGEVEQPEMVLLTLEDISGSDPLDGSSGSAPGHPEEIQLKMEDMIASDPLDVSTGPAPDQLDGVLQLMDNVSGTDLSVNPSDPDQADGVPVLQITIDRVETVLKDPLLVRYVDRKSILFMVLH